MPKSLVPAAYSVYNFLNTPFNGSHISDGGNLSTLTAPPVAPAHAAPTKLPGRRYDHLFFTSMVALMLLTVFLGFARTYYLAGVFHAPLPNLLIHLHGAAFSAWMLLLITQTSLVAAHRTDVHRRLGLAGFALGCAMIVLGVLAATDSLVRHAGQPSFAGLDPRTFYIIPITDIVLFGTLLSLGFRNRTDSPAHKRYLLLATTALLLAATARWPFLRSLLVADLFVYAFPVFLAAYDLWSTRKIHRVTLWAGAALIVVHQVRIPIGKTALWHSFADWVFRLAR